MAVLVFPKEKMVLGGKAYFFLLEKDGFGVTNQLFPRKKIVLRRKTNFFLGKTQENNKTIFCETMRPKSKMMVFFGFHRKKMVLDRKTKLFLGKGWFWR